MSEIFISAVFPANPWKDWTNDCAMIIFHFYHFPSRKLFSSKVNKRGKICSENFHFSLWDLGSKKLKKHPLLPLLLATKTLKCLVSRNVNTTFLATWHKMTKILKWRAILFSFRQPPPPFFHFIHIFHQETREIPQLSPRPLWPWWGGSSFPISDRALWAMHCWLWNDVSKIWCFMLPLDLFVVPTDFHTWESTISRKMSSKCIENAKGFSLAKWDFIPTSGHFASGSFA